MKHKTTTAVRPTGSVALSIALPSCLVAATLLTGTILASTTAKADDSVVDDVNITVPISCNMTGTGNTSHNAEIHNGQYTPDIGTTTLKVFCNDNEGFAIYANGYTNEEDGNNLLINNALSTNNTIATGTTTSGDTSNWAMKLTASTGNYTATLDNGFGNYSNVPTAFTKVAHRDSATDIYKDNDPTTAEGATLTTTYAAYINQTQSAGTYSGKVKYVLVHPSTAEAPVNADQVGVTYNGNGLTFASGASKNRVIYQNNCDTSSNCNISPVPAVGTYAETTTWKGKWYITSNNETTFLENEAAIINYLEQNSALLGTNVNIYAYNPYTIIYNGNNASAGTMTGFTTSMDTTSSTADLMAPNFKRTGYGFAGWSEEASATVNSSSKIYGPNEKVLGSDLSFNSSTRETTLYAVWVPTNGNMQSFSCSSLGNNQITALTDSRDNNVYTVGKMQDGNCWMMENLRLDNTATISSTNTNNPISTFTALSATNDSWCTANTDACMNQSVLNTNNTNIGGTNVAGTTLTVAPGLWNGAYWDDEQYNAGNNDHSQWYGYGNYYNWYSATAGNGTRSVSSGNVAGDICPTGWHLPNGGTGTGENGGATSGGFSYLDKQMGGTGEWQGDNEGEEIVSNRWRSYPNNFIYSGRWYGSSAYGRGSLGYYWSRTANTAYSAYTLYFNSAYVNPGTSRTNKGYGYSVRCIAQ